MKKLLLRRDVPKLGHVGDIVEVSEGYARNYLVPHHLACEPTQANLRAIEEEKKQAASLRQERRRALEARVAKMTNVDVTISAAANEEGRLYGSVGPREVAAALRDEGHEVETSQVQLHDAIRQLDSVIVPVVFADDLQAEVTVWVVRERASDEALEGEGADAEQAAPDMQEELDHGGSGPDDEADA